MKDGVPSSSYVEARAHERYSLLSIFVDIALIDNERARERTGVLMRAPADSRSQTSRRGTAHARTRTRARPWSSRRRIKVMPTSQLIVEILFM